MQELYNGIEASYVKYAPVANALLSGASKQVNDAIGIIPANPKNIAIIVATALAILGGDIGKTFISLGCGYVIGQYNSERVKNIVTRFSNGLDSLEHQSSLRKIAAYALIIGITYQISPFGLAAATAGVWGTYLGARNPLQGQEAENHPLAAIVKTTKEALVSAEASLNGFFTEASHTMSRQIQTYMPGVDTYIKLNGLPVTPKVIGLIAATAFTLLCGDFSKTIIFFGGGYAFSQYSREDVEGALLKTEEVFNKFKELSPARMIAASALTACFIYQVLPIAVPTATALIVGTYCGLGKFKLPQLDANSLIQALPGETPEKVEEAFQKFGKFDPIRKTAICTFAAYVAYNTLPLAVLSAIATALILKTSRPHNDGASEQEIKVAGQ